MKRMVSQALVALVLAGVVTGCTKEQSAATPKATVTAQRVAPTPVAQGPAAAEPAEPADELYVDLEGEPDEGPPPLTVKFTSSVEDGTPPYTYKWDFGDGSPANTEANPTHVYQKEGEFTATVEITDSKGIKGSEEYDILVEKE